MLTDKRLLAQVLGLLEVLLPLEEGKSLVNQRQNINSHRLALLLHLHSLVKLFDGLAIVLLVEEKLSVVVVDIGNVLKVFD